MKCSDEVLFCFISTLANNEGTQLELFKQTKKKIALHLQFEKLVKEEISIVKVLASNYPDLVVNQRQDSIACLDNLESKLKGTCEKKNEVLECTGALTITNLVPAIEPLQGFPTKIFNTFKSKLPSTIPLTDPSTMNH